MDKPKNKYIAVSYMLYTVENGKSELVEQTTAGKPFQFISGFGITLDEFEKQTIALEKGTKFDFTLTSSQAYGDYEPARVLDLERDIFCINGHFDHEHIYKGAIVPLQNEDGNHFYGRVLEVGTDKVKMDLNHPLAGKELNFKGEVIENRDATDDEIQGLISRLAGDGCGCGCDDCGDGCDCGHDHDHGHSDGCCGHGDGHHHHHSEGGCHHGRRHE